MVSSPFTPKTKVTNMIRKKFFQANLALILLVLYGIGEVIYAAICNVPNNDMLLSLIGMAVAVDVVYVSLANFRRSRLSPQAE